jgi:hypothetical protein
MELDAKDRGGLYLFADAGCEFDRLLDQVTRRKGSGSKNCGRKRQAQKAVAIHQANRGLFVKQDSGRTSGNCRGRFENRRLCPIDVLRQFRSAFCYPSQCRYG